MLETIFIVLIHFLIIIMHLKEEQFGYLEVEAKFKIIHLIQMVRYMGEQFILSLMS